MGRYLLECGHRRIAVVSGKENAAVSVLRLEGILDAYHDASCPIPQRNILVCDFNESIAYQKTKHFFSSPEGADVTAVFCLSDLMAFGAMRAMRDIGLTVPDDVSIAGFDGLMIGEWITPSLTTVTQDMRRMGYECASLLHGMIRGEETDSHRLLPYVLTKRASVTTNGNVYGK
jgi:DNA-binding LacI/PurR family transcriptional regulator